MIFSGRETPIHYYLVRVDGMNTNYHKLETEPGILLPEPKEDSTANLVDRGIVVDVPLVLTDGEEYIGEEICFHYIDAHASKVGNLPQIEGHLLVDPVNVIRIGDKMMGEHISCTPIPLWDGKGLLNVAYKKRSYDSLKTPELKTVEVYTSCGIVDRPNQYFPIGTKVWWGIDGIANPKWESGWLVKARYILMWGEKVDQFLYKKRK